MQYAQVSSLLGDEDELRKTTRSEAFKALPADERKAHREKIEAVHAEVTALQAAAGEAQGRLEAQRETIARQFPAYADLVAPTTPSRERLRSLLNPGEAKGKPSVKPATARGSGGKGERIIHAAVTAQAIQYDAEQGVQYGKVPALPEARTATSFSAPRLPARPCSTHRSVTAASSPSPRTACCPASCPAWPSRRWRSPPTPTRHSRHCSTSTTSSACA